MKKPMFLVYDQRYYQSPEDAVVMFTTDNEREASVYAFENNGVVVKEALHEIK